ncbi:response regulator transcription factor [Pseudomonas fontis]|nr:response regulator transcription factor [Pseudomonas fontis]
MSSVIIVDDHPAIRMAVKIVLKNSGYEVVGEASNGIDALRLIRELEPDLMILDIGIPEMDGMAVIERLKAQGRRTKTLVFTSQSAAIFSPRCRWAGTAGFVCKTGDMGEFVGALAAVKAGYSYFPSLPIASVETSSRAQVQGASCLTDREIDVLRQLASGASNKNIAAAMMLSHKTISSYKHRIMAKLSVGSFVELLEVAKRDSIV